MTEPALHAVVADHVFDGVAVHEQAAVIIDGTLIAEVVPRADVPRTKSCLKVHGSPLDSLICR
jgi:hypothetical protein